MYHAFEMVRAYDLTSIQFSLINPRSDNQTLQISDKLPLPNPRISYFPSCCDIFEFTQYRNCTRALRVFPFTRLRVQFFADSGFQVLRLQNLSQLCCGSACQHQLVEILGLVQTPRLGSACQHQLVEKFGLVQTPRLGSARFCGVHKI